jgi:hypothetical protein
MATPPQFVVTTGGGGALPVESGLHDPHDRHSQDDEALEALPDDERRKE